VESILLNRLCCPYDHTQFILQEKATSGVAALGETLLCPSCSRTFPIESGITRFLSSKDNELCPLQRSELEARDNEYRAGHSAGIDAHYAPEFDAIRAALGACRGLSVLDAGCGVGKFHSAVRDADLFLGLDFSWEGLIRFQNPKCSCTGLVQGDVTRMPLRDRVFDVAMSCQVLSHLPTSELRAQHLSELARVLKPKGRLILTTMHYSFRYRRRGIPQEAAENDSFYHRFEVAELRDLLSERFTIRLLHGYWIYLPKTYRLFVALGTWRMYWDRIWRSLPLSLIYGKYLLAVCSPKQT
jgi:ubiquinone/menaquinone biosynthesis C-methylase UbiE/uncharacterized protein YbaR (Trm112 family)